MKTCSCGRRYTAAQWAALRDIGSQFYEDETGIWYRLELKNCECQSTMAIEFRLPVEFRGTEDDARALCREAA
jgi:hypothetical protein